MFNGLGMHMGNLSRLSDAKTRSISPENFTGEKGKGGMCPLEQGSARHAARDLGTGWKVNPYIVMQPGEVFEIANIEGPGAIQHIWLTPTGQWRNTILRIYWEEQETPLSGMPDRRFLLLRLAGIHADLLAGGLRQPGQRVQLLLDDAVPPALPHGARKPRGHDPVTMYYQIDYTLTEVELGLRLFPRAVPPRQPRCPIRNATRSSTACAARGSTSARTWPGASTTPGWWGEGEIKFYMDGDTAYPTICGTRHGGLLLRLLQFRGPEEP